MQHAMAMHSRSIGFFLNSLEELEAISVQIRRLIAMQQSLSALLPVHLASQAQVLSEERGVLLLAAPNSAAAAKLRQLAPRIVAALVQRKFHIRALRVVVRVAQRTTEVRAAKRRITATAVHEFTELSRSVSHPPLRQALERLVGHQRGSSYQHEALEREQGKNDQQEDQRVLEDLPGEAQPAPVLSPEEGRERGPNRQDHEEGD
jgi:hypothetical protein